jgi:hypothetical protein
LVAVSAARFQFSAIEFRRRRPSALAVRFLDTRSDLSEIVGSARSDHISSSGWIKGVRRRPWIGR